MGNRRHFRRITSVAGCPSSVACRAQRGVTLIDTIVGTALMLVIFLGIAAAFELSLDVVSTNKARSGAIALGNERMEYIRSISYASVGTLGGIPSGNLAPTETIALNNTTYTRRTFVIYGDDPLDGIGAADTYPTGSPIFTDYKTAKVDVSWESRLGTRHITLVTRLEPPNGVETSCASCGTLVVNVVNAASQPVSDASVAVTNTTVSPNIDISTFTNASGTASFVGAPVGSGYHVVVTKSGYSSAQTYDATSQNTSPNPGNLAVSNGQTTSATFAIDLLSSMTVQTYSLSNETWQDPFNDSTKVDWTHSSNVEVAGNRLRLAGNQPFTQPGDARSIQISPSALVRWGTFSWNDTRPSETAIVYHLYYPDGGALALVPDSVLAGNAAGFTGVSVDASTIPAGAYPTLVLGATLTALNPNAPAPSIEDWQLTYEGGGAVNVTFAMRGAKTIGSGPGGTLYKYDNSALTTSGGSVALSNLEWDSYTMTILASTGYDLASSCSPQPVYLAPNTNFTAKLYFAPHTANSLLVDVKSAGGALLSGASVHLTKGGSYDATLVADACGQAFFGGLTNGSYTLEVSNPGNQTYSDSVNVTGSTRSSAVLN